MGKSALYSLSAGLRASAAATAAHAIEALSYPLELVEFITLPDLGQRVILRFGVTGGEVLPGDQIDTIELRLREAAGPEFWATLVWGAGAEVDFDMTERLEAIDAALPSSALVFAPTSHVVALADDGDLVRDALGLGRDAWVWEIEVPVAGEATPVIRVVDRSEVGHGPVSSRPNPEMRTIGDARCEVVVLQHNGAFAGCLKAYLASEQQKVALRNYLAGHRDLCTGLGAAVTSKRKR